MAAKRKRDDDPTMSDGETVHLQVVTGTYEKTLHGFIVSIPPASTAATASAGGEISLACTFTDTFLFAAHTSPLRTLTISPVGPNSSKRILATSSADERINLYTLSATLPPLTTSLLQPLSGRNRHLGTLHNHLNTPTALVFTPSRTKLLSASLDGTIQILRTRDWGLLSTLKAPKPKPKPINFARDYGEGYGPRISTFGDEGYGGGAGGVTDIALHPSQKILLSVGAGERAVRMWNLMTGRKAGVLAFDRETVPQSFGTDPTLVEWAAAGESYAVAFERGVLILGMDSTPRVRIRTSPPSKIHMMRFVSVPTGVFPGGEVEVLVLATEDGRVLFYRTDADNLDEPVLLGTLGGRAMGMLGRVKDFTVQAAAGRVFVVTGGSDGVVRVFDLCGEGSGIEVAEDETAKKVKGDDGNVAAAAATAEAKKTAGDKQVGKLIGVYETSRRITCLDAMLMHEGEEAEEEMADAQDEDESSEEESDDE